jgi:hypothetical protein
MLAEGHHISVGSFHAHAAPIDPGLEQMMCLDQPSTGIVSDTAWHLDDS